MKKTFLIIIALFFFQTASVLAEPIFYPANEKSIAWDAVPGANGYVVYYQVAGVITKAGETTATTYKFVFDVDMQIIVGVAAVRRETVNGQPTEIFSATAWSDNPADCLGGATFGLYYFKPPAKPGGLRMP